MASFHAEVAEKEGKGNADTVTISCDKKAIPVMDDGSFDSVSIKSSESDAEREGEGVVEITCKMCQTSLLEKHKFCFNCGASRFATTSTEQYEAIIQSVFEVIGKPIMFFKCSNQNASLTYASGSIRQILGWSPEEVIGRSGFDFIHPDDRGILKPDCDNYFDSKEGNLKKLPSQVLEYRRICKDSTFKHVKSIVINNFSYTDFHETFWFEYQIDEEVASREAFVNSATKFTILKHISNKIGSLAIRINQQGKEKQLSLSKQLIDMLQWSKQKNTKYTIESFMNAVHEEDKERFQSMIQRCFDDKIECKMESCFIKFRTGTGSTLYTKFCIGKLAKDNDAVDTIHGNAATWINQAVDTSKTYCGLFLDITDESLDVEQQQEVIAKLSAEKYANEIQRFVSYVFHEVRNPLNTVSLGVHSLLDENPDSSMLKSMHLSLLSASKILDDTIDLTRVQQGKITMEFQKLDLEQLIDLACESYEKNMKAIKFIKSVPENLNTVVLADSARLLQVLHNLISNAMKFSPENSTIIIKLESIHVPSNGGAAIKALRFSITDRGCGIKEEELKKIFEPFVKAAKANQSAHVHNERGAGLGLAISDTIMKLHNGRLFAVSQHKKGSTFSFYIPTAPAFNYNIDTSNKEDGKLNSKSDDIELGQVESPTFANLKILLVDDDPMCRLMLKRILLKQGCIIHELVNGLEFLAACNGYDGEEKSNVIADEFDIVLLDDCMDVMDGSIALEKARAFGFSVCTYMCSGNATQQHLEKFEQRGADGVLKKPINMKKLNVVLNEAYNSKKWR